MEKFEYGLSLKGVCDAIDAYRENEDDVPEAGMIAAFKILLADSSHLRELEDKLRIKQNHIRLRDSYIEELEQRAEAAEAQLAELAKQDPIYQLIDDGNWYDAEKYIYDECVRNGDKGRIVFTRAAPAAVPDGWTLVPVEPRWEMLSADGCKDHHNGQPCSHHDNRRRIWSAMLAAAPDCDEVLRRIEERQC